jgi:hypothetical protein
MIKRDELRVPHSCMSRAQDDEMTFVLLARDAAAPAAIRMWCAQRISLGKNKGSDPQIQEALLCAQVMEEQRRAGKFEAPRAPKHVCGLQGFGALGDTCPGCESGQG